MYLVAHSSFRKVIDPGFAAIKFSGLPLFQWMKYENEKNDKDNE